MIEHARTMKFGDKLLAGHRRRPGRRFHRRIGRLTRVAMENKFWASTYKWPEDPKGYVFLARAVQRVGSAMFGGAWTGREVLAEYKWWQPPSKVPRAIPPSLVR